ncbi:MAG: ferritin-like domain-containing protein [Bifidobacteriaceae bacterium]|nr:ferritin-like domain-containing protein [Bifidobacteriaceae bacterium]
MKRSDAGLAPPSSALPPGGSAWAEPVVKGPDGGERTGPPPRSSAHAHAVTVLALVAAVSQTAFCQHARDAAASDRVAIRVTMADIAAAEQDRCRLAREGLAHLGVDPLAEMVPYLRELSGFDCGSATDQWWERVLGTYLTHGIASQTKQVLAANLDASARGLVEGLLDDCAGADYLRALLVSAGRGDSRRTARLSLWGRRVAGDALGMIAGMVTRIGSLGELAGFTTDDGVARLHAELSAAHSRRMEGLGLTP